jgi:hypothetical protein
MRKAKESLKNEIIGNSIMIFDSKTTRIIGFIPTPGCDTSGFELGIARGSIPDNLSISRSFLISMEAEL